MIAGLFAKKPITEYPDGLPTPRRYFSVAAIWLAMAVTVLDSAIANVALPTIADNLRISEADSVWVVNAYQLAIIVCLLPLAARGERLGFRRVYLAGIVIFTLGSLGCVLSQTLGQLTAARVLQGVGASGIMSVNSALVRFTYPHSQLGRGIGMNAVLVAVASAAGPSIASAILAVADWRWLFAVNLPIGAISLAIGLWALPHNHGAKRPFDLISALLNGAAFLLLILGVETLAKGQVALGGAEIAVGAVCGAVLLARERKVAYPLVPIDLMRIPMFRLSIGTSTFTFMAQMAAFIALPFHLQALGYTAVQTGLLMTPWPIALCLTAPLAGYLADRRPVGVLVGAGLGVFAVGLLLLSGIGPDSSKLDIVWRMAVCGAGFGFFQAPNNRAMMGTAPRARAGAAGGMIATARTVGQTNGALIIAILFHMVGPAAPRFGLVGAAIGVGVAMVFNLLRLKEPPLGKAELPGEQAGEGG